MTVRPGKNLLLAGVGLVALSLVGFFTNLIATPLGVAGALLAIACSWDYRRARRGLDALSVRRDLPGVVGRGLPFLVRQTVKNASADPVRGFLRDVRSADAEPNYTWSDFRVGAAKAVDLDESIRIPIRGEHRFGPTWLRVVGPLGLIEAQKPIESVESVRILPETFASRDQLIKDIGAEVKLLDQVKTTRQTGGGTEFDSLYPYQWGDDPRRIDWRATARAARPIVRHFQVERHRDVMLVVDCGRLMASETGAGSKLDRAVDSCLHLAGVALRGGDRCGVGVFDDRVRGYLPPVTGPASLRTVVESLYDARTEWRESDFTRMFAELQARQAKRSLVVILSDLSDEETSSQLRASLLRLAKRHLVLFVAIRTPLLSREIAKPIDSITGGARTAVAMRLVRERRQSLHALQRGGVHVLDVEPRQLTVPLVNRFLTLRGGRLL